MATHAIGLSEPGYVQFQEAIHRFKERGFEFSATRAVMYLVTFEKAVLEAFDKAVNAEKGQEALDILKHAILTHMQLKPPVIPRGNYKPSRYAPLEKRILVTKQIEERLGLVDPPKEIVDYYLDHGTDELLRRQVLKNQDANLKSCEPPAQTEGP